MPSAALVAAYAGLAGAAALGGCRGGEQKQPMGAATAAEPSPSPSEAATSAGAAADAGAAGEGAKAAMATAAGDGGACRRLDFVSSLPIAEASAAVVTTLDGVATLMVIGDSGHEGDYLLVDPQSGVVRERGKLPLGQKGDDLEGLAVRGDRLWGLTSSGWLRAWTRRAKPPGFDLVAGPLPIGHEYVGGAPPGDAMSCDLRRANCGRNFEGLCLAAPEVAPAGAGCVGMAASKAEGRLYCVVEREGALTVDAARFVSLAKPDALADCNIDGDTLWAGANVFSLNQVWKVTGWRDPAKAQVAEVGAIGVGFCEGIAASGDTLFRLSDTQGDPSLISKFRCSPPTK